MQLEETEIPFSSNTGYDGPSICYRKKTSKDSLSIFPRKELEIALLLFLSDTSSLTTSGNCCPVFNGLSTSGTRAWPTVGRILFLFFCVCRVKPRQWNFHENPHP
ncbi:hypothetical protein CDAR_101041 [Caerostris darwini]|uniref:Uncharacterized protein n=1 Tax=Caerostris darwini TaxID=1538125 RepID=A0AAV4N945_9ARAC|nr:hypothetical protein CDAR_101041 [Caerostris darwini]